MGVDDTIAQAAAPSAVAVTHSAGLDALIGQTIAGRYRIDRVLGEGGMGTVFAAEHLTLGMDVAVKVLLPALSQHPEAAPRFEREALAASRLEHPNVVRVTDFGEVEAQGVERPIKFLVMQVLEGEELSRRLGQPLPPLQALALAEQIFAGLAHAHEHGVIHRDLKPDNVFVTTDHDGREILKIVDFGIAKLRDGDGAEPAKPLTQVGMVFGTPAYMSPEQAVGKLVDGRTDIYAVGVMLYEMLSGHRPFRSSDPMALLRMQILAECDPIPGLPPVVQDLLDGLLAKEPEDRIGTAAGALAKLRATADALRGGADTVAANSAPGPAKPVEDDALAPTVLPIAKDFLSGVSGEFKQATKSLLDLVPPTIEKPKRLWVGIGAGFGVFVLLVWAMSGGDDEAEAEPEPTPEARQVVQQAAAELGAVANQVGEHLGLRAPDDRLAEVDALLAQRKWKAARSELQALLSEFEDDGRIWWRQGQLLALNKQTWDEAGKAYAKALQLDPSLARNPEFAEQVAGFLRDGPVASELVHAVAGRAAVPLRKALVTAANRPSGALPYRDRHTIIDALGEDAVNRPLSVSLDLWQAPETSHPCQAYADALDGVIENPHPFMLGSVKHAPVPEAGPREDPSACNGLEARRQGAEALVDERYPNATLEYPADHEVKKKRRRGGRRRIFRIFR